MSSDPNQRGAGYALAVDEALEEWSIGGDLLRLLVSAERSAGAVTVLEGLLHGVGPPLHVHDDEDEVVTVLDGRLAYAVGGSTGEIGAGGTLWMPRGFPHAFSSRSETPCRFLAMAVPGGIEVLFRAQQRYLSGLPDGVAPDPEAMARLEGADTRRVVGPPLMT